MENIGQTPSFFIELTPIIAAIITSAISALIAYIVSKKQAESTEKQLDKEISAGIKKVKYEYELEQKRDDSNFVNKFKLEKLAHLYELIGRYERYNTRKKILIKNFLVFNKHKEITDKEVDSYIEKRDIIETEEFSENINRKITIEVCYFPKIKKEWEEAASYNLKIIDLYIDQMLGRLEIKDEKHSGKKIPKNYSLNEFLNDIEISDLNSANIMESIEEEIEIIMSKLENN